VSSRLVFSLLYSNFPGEYKSTCKDLYCGGESGAEHSLWAKTDGRFYYHSVTSNHNLSAPLPKGKSTISYFRNPSMYSHKKFFILFPGYLVSFMAHSNFHQKNLKIKGLRIKETLVFIVVTPQFINFPIIETTCKHLKNNHVFIQVYMYYKFNNVLHLCLPH
jgi:hypothetical protein